MAEMTPVTLLIGGAGSGRSKVLHHLQGRAEGARLGIVTTQPEPLVRWNAGCACCAPQDDIARALRALLPRARRDEVRHVIVASPGLADPGPALATLLSDPVAASAFRLNGIVAVIGASQRAAILAADATALRQIAIADRFVLIEAGHIGDLKAGPEVLYARLRELNPGASVEVAPDGAIDPRFILDSGVSGPAADLQAWLPVGVSPAPRTVSPTDLDGATFQLFRHVIRDPLSKRMSDAWTARLVLMHGASVLRMKAVLHVRDQPGPLVIHSVRHLLFPPIALPAWPVGDTRQSRLALIAHNARWSELRALLDDLAATAEVQ